MQTVAPQGCVSVLDPEQAQPDDSDTQVRVNVSVPQRPQVALQLEETVQSLQVPRKIINNIYFY